MSRCAKWRAVIPQRRKSLEKFLAWVSESCAISQKFLLRPSKSGGNNVKLKLASSAGCDVEIQLSHHSLMLSRPVNFQPLLVNSNRNRIGAFSMSSGVPLKGQ